MSDVGQNQYRCEQCGGVFDKGWTDDEATDELKANGWGFLPADDLAIICDDCYKALKVPTRST